MELGKCLSKETNFPHSCPYCRRMTRGIVYYWELQPRLFFDTYECAQAWSKTLADKNSNPTWQGVRPENKTVKIVKEKFGWLKRLFSGDSSQNSE